MLDQRTTLAHVAEAAGVSVSTASRALNGLAENYRISGATAERVCRAAERLNFSPNQVARSLQSRRSGLVGVVVPDLSNPFFGAIARQVTRRAEEAERSVLICDSREETAREVEMVSQLQSRQVEGLVVCPVGVEFGHLRRLHEQRFPLVLVDRVTGDSAARDAEIASVTSDHAGGARKSIRQLLNAGHRVIGCLQGRPETLPNDKRLSAARQILREAGLKLGRRQVAGDDFTEESGFRATRQVLEQSPETTALFAFSAPIAVGALRSLAEMGRAVPEDVSLVTFDDVPYADLMHVPVTSVVQDVERLGRTAAEVLAKQLASGRSPRRRKHVVPVRLLRRGSVAKRGTSRRGRDASTREAT